MWIATSDPAITQWDYASLIDKTDREPVHGTPNLSSSYTATTPSSSMKDLKKFEKIWNEKPKPLQVLPGSAGIVKHSQLNDRVHVLAQDTLGMVTLWNVTTVCQVLNHVTFVRDKWKRTMVKSILMRLGKV